MTYVEEIARSIAAEAGAEFTGDERWLFLLYALLALTRGEAVTDHDIHDGWVTWMLLLAREHESMVPFDSLDPDTKAEDTPYRDAVRRVVRVEKPLP